MQGTMSLKFVVSYIRRALILTIVRMYVVIFSESRPNFYFRLCFAVFDSSAKIPSGLLNGNINQYGDFDQCLDVKTELDPLMYPHLENYRILGKYCLATFDLDIRKSSARSAILVEVDDLIHAHRSVISTVNDVSLANSVTHCGRVTQICVFNTVKLGTSASSP